MNPKEHILKGKKLTLRQQKALLVKIGRAIKKINPHTLDEKLKEVI